VSGFRGAAHDNLRMQRAVFEDAQHWDELDRDAEALYRGARLEAAGTWADTHHDELNNLERDFIQASHEDAAVRKRRQRRTTRLLRGLSVFLLLAVVAVSFLALQARRTSERYELLASREFARADGAYDTPFELAGLATFMADGSTVADAQPSDDPQLGSATVRLTDVETGSSTVVEIGAADARATSIAFSPEGNLVAWAYARRHGGEIVVWDLNKGAHVAPPIRREDGYIFNLRFSRDSEFLTWFEIGPATGDIVRWNLEDGRRSNPDPKQGTVSSGALGLTAIPFAAGRRFTEQLSGDGELAVFQDSGADFCDPYVFWDVARSLPIGAPVAATNMSDRLEDDYCDWLHVDMAFLPGRRVALVSPESEQPFLWHIEDRRRQDFVGVPANVNASGWLMSQDGSTLLLCSTYRDEEEPGEGSWTSVDLWTAHARTFEPAFASSPRSTQGPSALDTACPLTISEDGSVVAISSHDQSGYSEDEGVDPSDSDVVAVSLHDERSGQQSGLPFVFRVPPEMQSAVLLNPAGSTHAVVLLPWEERSAQEVVLWDVASGERIN
jgi:hypothetical protein